MNLISHVAAKLKIYKKFVVYKKVLVRTTAYRSPPRPRRGSQRRRWHTEYLQYVTVAARSRHWGGARDVAETPSSPRWERMAPVQTSPRSLKPGWPYCHPWDDTPQRTRTPVPSGSSSTPGTSPIPQRLAWPRLGPRCHGPIAAAGTGVLGRWHHRPGGWQEGGLNPGAGSHGCPVPPAWLSATCRC